MRSLREQAKALEHKKSRDYDPEDDVDRSEEEEDSDAEEESTSAAAGREHYQDVGKSRLRTPGQPALGARYGGVAVSRKALDEQEDSDEDEDPLAPVDDEDDEDPFAAKNAGGGDSDEESDGPSDLENDAEIDEEDEIDSDEALGESDVERFRKFTFRGSKSNRNPAAEEDGLSSEVSEGDEENDVSDSPEDSDMEVDDHESEDESEDDASDASSTSSPRPETLKPAQSSAREELRKAATSSSSSAALASALSAGANADVKKGQAVKQQRQAFDRLLDTRMKLQKGLTAANELQDAAFSDEDVKTAAQQAEDAALALWSTIDAIRCSFLSAQDTPGSKANHEPTKRKRPLTATRSTSTSELWQRTQTLHSTTQPLYRATLDKWNSKTQPVLDSAPRSKLLQGSQAHPSRLTEVLDTYLSSSAPALVQASAPEGTLYDDAAFYQSLLRDLIASRAAGNDALSAAMGDSYLPPKLHVSGSRAKKVDTKASKGRKVRYNVHEKLQDFMAAEDRGTWEEAARREFFASLFGNRGVLDEVDQDEDEDLERPGDGREETALRLFRS